MLTPEMKIYGSIALIAFVFLILIAIKQSDE